MVKVLNRIQPAHNEHITTLLCACHNQHLLFLFVHIQNGKTPLDLARKSWNFRRSDVVKYLQEKLGKCIRISTL